MNIFVLSTDTNLEFITFITISPACSDHKITAKPQRAKMCSWNLYQKILHQYPNSVLGSHICRNCERIFLATDLTDHEDVQNVTADPDFDVSTEKPGELVDVEIRLKLKADLDILCNNLGVQTVEHQLLQPVEEVSQTTVIYYKKIYQNLQEKLSQEFAKRVAPGQSEQFLKMLSS